MWQSKWFKNTYTSTQDKKQNARVVKKLGLYATRKKSGGTKV